MLEKDAEMRVLLYSYLAAEGSEFSQEVRQKLNYEMSVTLQLILRTHVV